MKINIDIIKPSKASVDARTFVFKIGLLNKLDQNNCEELEMILMILIAGGARRILFDLDELRYIDSSGIGKIINITKLLRTQEGNVVISRCSPNITEILQLVHMEKFIKIFSSNEEGISYLKLT